MGRRTDRSERKDSMRRSAGHEKFKFRKFDTIGDAAAESDTDFLSECWIDTGDLAVLQNCDRAPRIVLGRTGSGKSALLMRLDEYERVVWLLPDDLALAYVANSTILIKLSEMGVKVDPFFRLLWRHVLAVELIRSRFQVRDEATKASFLERIRNRFRDRKYADALQYLEDWGRSFWEDTDYRIRELTTKLETDVKTSLGAKANILSGNLDSSQKISDQERVEIVQRAQNVINQVQLNQLSKIIEMLQVVFDDPQKKLYVVIDRLDENWVEDRVRYLLIRALIETIRDFQKVHPVKIVIALTALNKTW